jgi:hypothetical protein
MKTILACTYLSIQLKERLQPISLTFLLRFCLLRRSYSIVSNPPMGNLKDQLSSYGNTITSLIRMVRPSIPSTCVSPSYTVTSLNSFDLRTNPLSCIIIMHYLPPTVIGLRKNPLITFVLLYILVERTGLPQGESVK